MCETRVEADEMNQSTLKDAAKQKSPQRILIERGVTKISIGQSRIRITYAAEKNTAAIQAMRSILLNAAPF